MPDTLDARDEQPSHAAIYLKLGEVIGRLDRADSDRREMMTKVDSIGTRLSQLASLPHRVERLEGQQRSFDRAKQQGLGGLRLMRYLLFAAIIIALIESLGWSRALEALGRLLVH